MRAKDLLESVAEDVALQREVNAFLDEFRAADVSTRRDIIADGPKGVGRREGYVAAIVSALCREVGMDPPPWVAKTYSPEPYFVLPAKGFALRLRLMLESPPPFRVRNVFVPENFLSRA
jgi:hypothetical protein